MSAVIWRGAGILGIALPIGAVILATYGLDYALGDGWNKTHTWYVGATLALCGIALWLLGRKLNHPPNRKLDLLTEQHTLFFVIPLEYTAIFWVPVGLFLFAFLK
ncbi:MAG: hypothetical protein LBV44_00370 [Methylobacillus sp.]|jgi:hypothetical protein|nr:hypothetical protein [Methylobacillus sp.]